MSLTVTFYCFKDLKRNQKVEKGRKKGIHLACPDTELLFSEA